MQRARVIGEVWATKKCPGLEGQKLRIIAPLEVDATLGRRSPAGPVVVAVDLLDSKIGEDVIVAFGSGARNAVRSGDGGKYDLMIDAALVQITDGACSLEE